MGHTNTTPNYNLPQFLGSDKPAWLTDVNNAMSAIDTAIAAAKAAADNAGGAAAALATTVGGHTTQLETLSNTVTNQGASIVSQGNAINTISELIGNGTPTTTDHTLIGAINELNAKEGDLADLQTTDKSSLVAAINEAAQSGGGGGSREHVTITTGASTTYAQALAQLETAIDTNKITPFAVVTIGNEMYNITNKSASHVRFSNIYGSGTNSMYAETFDLIDHVALLYTAGGSVTDISSQSNITANVDITLYY